MELAVELALAVELTLALGLTLALEEEEAAPGAQVINAAPKTPL